MELIISFLDKIFAPLAVVVIVATLAAVAVHYLLAGPKHPELAKQKRDVRRFSLWEKLIHVVTLISFVTLAVTGFAATLYFKQQLTGWWRAVHLIAAPFFTAGLAAMALSWPNDCKFKDFDWQWAKMFGGYLGEKEYVPAGRFNAGQKAFFWAVALFGLLASLSGIARVYPFSTEIVQQTIYQIHRYTSLLLLVFVIAHIYLGTIANPGTFRVILSGYVSWDWAKIHHPIWWKKLDKTTGQD